MWSTVNRMKGFLWLSTICDEKFKPWYDWRISLCCFEANGTDSTFCLFVCYCISSTSYGIIVFPSFFVSNLIFPFLFPVILCSVCQVAMMHQWIPGSPPSPPLGNCGAFCPPCQSRGWGFGGSALANPRGIPGLLTPTWFRGNDQRFVANWFFQQGLEKLVDVFKGMFS